MYLINGGFEYLTKNPGQQGRVGLPRGYELGYYTIHHITRRKKVNQHLKLMNILHWILSAKGKGGREINK